ncbi:FUSC family membrane protein [Roseiarcus sp.]|uniref:FUSC family membrane protein n=1 Tax=Roseiarcus sp. TaxID=1969460 RepID=UPI003D0BD85D
MPRWPRPPNLLRLFVGQHIINGASVGLGVVAVALVSSAIFGFAAGQPATLGAIAASISDLPAPWREKAKTLGFGFALALLSTVAIQLALPWPVAALVMIGLISFVGGLVTGLGRWAVAVGMQAVIPMVFILGFPRETFPAAVRIELLLAGGGVAYIAFALLATVFTDASARRLVTSESIREFSMYMRAVAGVFDPDQELAAAYGATIRQQSMLSEQLQSARSVLLERPGEKGERMRLAASIGILLDALDALVAAQCDVDLIRQTPEAATVLARIGDALRVGSFDLEHLSLELLTTGRPILPPDHQLAIDALKREAARAEAEAMDPKARAALVATTWRLVLSLSHIRRLERALSDDETARASIGDVNLAAFIPKRRYAPSALAPHLSLESPVLRFSVRLALAMMAGAVVAQSLGDERHGNWVLLTIAVVMRAGYGLTKQRRDDRVIGTLIGCVVAAGSVAYLPAGALVAVQGLAVAVTHSFARLNYRVASSGTSVTALVSLHLVQPWVSAPILVRLADTLIGAAIAHLFNYLWPRWESSEAPRLASRLQAQLAAFAAAALRADVSDHDYRLARKNVIEAIAALSDSAGRMSSEPMAARKGLDEMANLLIAAYSLVAELSAARLAVQTGAPPLNPAIRERVQGLLAGQSGAAASDAPAGPLAAAALAVTSAARNYERVAKTEGK